MKSGAIHSIIPAKAGIPFFVIPAKAGIQTLARHPEHAWTPAFAGVTVRESVA
jgi:hypothetical protein